MRILYVAKHDQVRSNDDEGAITDALTKLGHDVQRVREKYGSTAHKVDADFCLFHHWNDFAALKRVKCPKVFWCFDLIDARDPTLVTRSKTRIAWIREATSLVSLGFCTDGDWVAGDNTRKLHQLMQGADQRYVGKFKVNDEIDVSSNRKSGVARMPLLFTGIAKGGTKRQSFVDEMLLRYGCMFSHYSGGKHGHILAELIASASIVLAPDAPITDHYWSNRVYLTLGYGGFLLHPYCNGLWQHYDDTELAYYRSRAELHELITYFLERPDVATRRSAAGLARTIRDHTYVNRCAELCKIVESRLL